MPAMPDGAVLAARIDELAAAWAADPEIAAAWLFGSRAAARARADSDVDLAVVLTDRLDRAGRDAKRLSLLADACARLRTDAVDLVVLEDVPSVLGHRIVGGGRRIAVSDEHRTVHVVEDVLRRYLDEAYLRDVLDAGLGARVREGRYAG